MQTRRDFLKSSGAMLGGALLAAPARRPNLVFIIADQHSGTALGCAGNRNVETPRLDAFARQGVVFTHAFTAGITCSPSRTSLHTGLHVHSHGVRVNDVPEPQDCPSLQSTLQEAGYRFGPGIPNVREYMQWLAAQGLKDIESPIVGSKAKAEIVPMPYRFAVGRAGLEVDQTLDAFAIRQAIGFLENRPKDAPFCLYVRLHGSHDPYTVPAPYSSMYKPADLPMPPYRAGEYDEKPRRQKAAWQSQHADELDDAQIRTILAHYYGMISMTDRLVGRLVDRIAQLGLNDNTVVVYTVDHGDTMGHHRMFTKGFAFYEQSMRIPWIARAPGLPRGMRVDAPVSGIDMFPTMLELLGFPAPRGVHGRSLVPLWRGKERTAHEAIFAGQGFEGTTRLTMVRTPEWKFTRYDDGGAELYNLTDDPNELNNLIRRDRHAIVAKKLAEQLEDWDRRSPHAELRFPPSMNEEDRASVRLGFERWREAL